VSLIVIVVGVVLAQNQPGQKLDNRIDADT
jgi:hypothetical protein